MARKPESVVRELEQTGSYTYRCPGCGEMVDNRQMDEVLAHHQHVILRPPPPLWFEHVARAGGGETAKTNHPLRVHPNDTYETSATRHSRRDGHE